MLTTLLVTAAMTEPIVVVLHGPNWAGAATLVSLEFDDRNA
ncbi:hypothetical protein ACQPZQ_17315 [Pseudonocardia sp. CA-142604]